MVKITKISENTFQISLEDKNFKVTIDEDFHPEIPKEKLIEASFKFLLGREPKESILKEFNLKKIIKYFPEYEENLSNYL